jgi:hypothetical protein
MTMQQQLPPAQLRQLRDAEDKEAALTAVLDDEPTLIDDDAFSHLCEAGGTPSDDYSFRIMSVEQEGQQLCISALVFFEEDFWAGGCSDIQMSEDRAGELEFSIDLETGEMTFPLEIGK